MWLKWRWEFMRRNPKYRSDYKKFQTLKECDTEMEKKRCDKWGLVRMFNPDKTFEELIEKPDDSVAEVATTSENVKKWIPVFNELIVFNSLDPHAVTVGTQQTVTEVIKLTTGKEVLALKAKTDPPKFLTIHIDFSKVNSIPGLKKMINSLIDERVEMISHLNHLRSQNDPIACAIPAENLCANIHRTNKTDFEIILQVGDLKRKDLTNQQIAKKMFPRDFNPNNENGNPESKTRLISLYYTRYNKLVNGGYKTLTSP